jgi:hypothetical protein
LIFVALVHEAGDAGPFLGVLLVELDEQVVLLRGPGLNFALPFEALLLLDLEFYDLATLALQLHHYIILHLLSLWKIMDYYLPLHVLRFKLRFIRRVAHSTLPVRDFPGFVFGRHLIFSLDIPP